MGYISLIWPYSIPHITKDATASDYHPAQKGCMATQAYYYEPIVKQLHINPVILCSKCLHSGVHMFEHTGHEMHDKINTFTKMTLGLKSN